METDEEKQKDAQERIEAFKKESTELANKYDVDLYSYPQFVPNPNGTFTVISQIQILDRRQLGQVSPFQSPDIT